MNSDCLLHGRIPQLVLPADALAIVDSTVVETQKEVDQSQEVSLLSSHFFLRLQYAQALSGKKLRLDLQHAHQHQNLLGTAEFSIKGVHEHACVAHIDGKLSYPFALLR